MTTKIKWNVNRTSELSNLAPYLGEVWSHFPNLRLLLTWKSHERYAFVCKSSEISDVGTPYQINVKSIH